MILEGNAMDIMIKTYELIDVLDNSLLIKDLENYKNKILCNKELCELVDKGNNEKDEYVLMGIKRELYKYPEYKKYQELYSELNFIVMDINNRYKSLFNERSCII